MIVLVVLLLEETSKLVSCDIYSVTLNIGEKVRTGNKNRKNSIANNWFKGQINEISYKSITCKGCY